MDDFKADIHGTSNAGAEGSRGAQRNAILSGLWLAIRFSKQCVDKRSGGLTEHGQAANCC
jgi:hypothetical protein